MYQNLTKMIHKREIGVHGSDGSILQTLVRKEVIYFLENEVLFDHECLMDLGSLLIKLSSNFRIGICLYEILSQEKPKIDEGETSIVFVAGSLCKTCTLLDENIRTAIEDYREEIKMFSL